MFIIFSVFYILIAAAMIVLILMQRGQGADAGAGFGAGASGTVFGARGSASFLTRATGMLATLFFLLSLGMAIYFSHHGAPKKSKDLGVMSGDADTGRDHRDGARGHGCRPSATSASAEPTGAAVRTCRRCPRQPAVQAAARRRNRRP